MHSSLPLLALTLLGALVLPDSALAQQASDTTAADTTPATPLTAGLLAASLKAPAISSQGVTVVTSAPSASVTSSPAPAAPVSPAPAAELPAESTPVPVTTTAPVPARKVLTGNVVDEWGDPLVGATVIILDSKEPAVTTNSQGDYLISTTSAAPVLRISFAGYQDAERIARGPADLLFKLDPVRDYKQNLKKRSKAAVKAWKR